MPSTAPSYSQAAVLRQFRTPLRIEEVPIPKEIEPGAILTRIETCSICGTDVHLWQGSLALRVELPVIIGHEMVGRIVALGSGADRDSIGQPLRTGDRITWTHTSCGSCFYCTVAQEPTLCQHSRMYMYESMNIHVRVHEQLSAPAWGLLRIRLRDAGGRPGTRPGQCAERT